MTRIALPVPKGLPPVYHPFEGSGAVCAYCELPRKVHVPDRKAKA